MNRTPHHLSIFFFSLLTALPVLASELPVQVAAYDPNIRYIGRFDMRDEKGPICNWSACASILRFDASAIRLNLLIRHELNRNKT